MAEQRRQRVASILRRLGLRSPGRYLFVIALVALVLGTHGRIFNPIYRAFALSCELLHLRGEHQRLVEENGELTDWVQYLQTDAGQELMARSELGAVKKGERLIITSSPEPLPPPRATLPQLVHRCLTRGQEVIDGATEYLVELGICLFGVADASPPPAAADAQTEGAEQ